MAPAVRQSDVDGDWIAMTLWLQLTQRPGDVFKR
jgi:hypothetical protein